MPSSTQGSYEASAESCWGLLQPEIIERIASFLDPNEVAGTVRLLNKEASALLKERKAIRLSQPFPHHAFVRYWAGPCGCSAIARLPYARRRRLLRLAAASCDVPSLVTVARRVLLYLPPLGAEVLEAAAVAGRLDTCRYLLAAGCSCDAVSLLVAAAGAGRQAVCEALLDEGHCQWSEAAVRAAVLSGHLALSQWLLRRQPSGDRRRVRQRAVAWRLLGTAWAGSLAQLQELLRDAAAAAATGGAPPGGQQQQQQQQQQQLREWLMAGLGPKALRRWDQAEILAAAAGSRIEWRQKVEWLEGLGFPKTRAALTAAAQRDGRARLDWLASRGGYPPPNAGVANAAMCVGNAEAVGQLAAAGVRPEWKASAVAGAAGHLEALGVLHAHGFSDLGHVRTAAAEAGQLDVLKWVVLAMEEWWGDFEGNGNPLLIPMRATMMSWCAAAGSVAMLAWARARGYAWPTKTNTNAYISAAGAGSVELLCWLAANGCPMPTDGAPYQAALSNGDGATVLCLNMLGLRFGGDTYRQSLHAPWLPVLRWLVTKGCPVEWGRAEDKALDDCPPCKDHDSRRCWLCESTSGRRIGAPR